MSAHEINLALRTAAGHERAAIEAETAGAKQFEMKMKSAGASVYAAFVLAAKAAPELQGRKLDDKAIARLYASTTRRPWWDEHLAKVKVAATGKAADREWGKRLIQWHLDPAAAQARRAQHSLREATLRNRLKEQSTSASRGARAPQAPSAKEAAAVREAARTTALAGRELPRDEKPVAHATREDCLGELNRMRSALGALKEPAQFDEALELLKATARDLERL